MPGIARIDITCVPQSGYSSDILDKIQIQLDEHFTSATQRELGTLIVTGNPTWLEILNRLDAQLISTAIGPNRRGAVKPDPTQTVDPQKWNWTPVEHEYVRPLYFGKASWEISVDKKKYLAKVVAKYSYRHADLLA